MDCAEVLSKKFRVATTPWNQRNKKTKNFKKTKDKVLNFIKCVSGDDIMGMLVDVLDEKLLHQIQSKFKNALKLISDSVNNKIKSKNKHNFIRPLRKAKLTQSEAHELGFKFSPDLWLSCLSDHDRHIGGNPALSIKRPEEVFKIKNHMESLANPASHRSVDVKTFETRPAWASVKKRKIISKEPRPVMYRETTMLEAFKQFIEKNESDKSVSLPTFVKYTDARFKRPRKKTDVCDYCEYGKLLFKNVRFFLQKYYEPITQEQAVLWNTDKDWQGLKNYLEFSELISAEKFQAGFSKKSPNFEIYENAMVQFNQNCDKLDEIELHKYIAKRQRQRYNEYKSEPSLLEGKLMIEIDYKQKIPLDNGPVQISSEFFTKKGDKKKRVVCLGFGIYVVKSNDQMEKFNFCYNLDIISDDLRADAFMLKLMFRYVMSLDLFKEIDQPTYVIWTDCGKQFRCQEFYHFLFVELANEGKNVELNFFAEKHGNLKSSFLSYLIEANIIIFYSQVRTHETSTFQ